MVIHLSKEVRLALKLIVAKQSKRPFEIIEEAIKKIYPEEVASAKRLNLGD